MSEPPSSTGRPMTAEELRLFRSQLIAFAIDMHATCSVRRCRRKKRCLVPGAPCLRRHWGLAQDRITGLVWDEGN